MLTAEVIRKGIVMSSIC